VQWLRVSEVGIEASGESRFALRLGGRFGLVGGVLCRPRPRAWQIGIEAGFYGQFDNDHSQDNIGWDGYYGLVATAKLGPRVALKLGVMHDSAHVGDEYAQRTGRQRIDYTRQEVQAGVSWAVGAEWRLYAEAGWGHDLRNEELQKPGRAQLGVEWRSGKRFLGGRAGWFAAADLAATEERQWQGDLAGQFGIFHQSPHRLWRLAIEAYDGRSPLGEFFFADEPTNVTYRSVSISTSRRAEAARYPSSRVESMIADLFVRGDWRTYVQPDSVDRGPPTHRARCASLEG
jgi:hypothetical protein